MKTKKLVMAALLGALAAILMVLDFNVPFVPMFIKIYQHKRNQWKKNNTCKNPTLRKRFSFFFKRAILFI